MLQIQLIKDTTLSPHVKLKTLAKMDAILGLDMEKAEINTDIDEEVRTLIEKREQARKNKDFTLADNIRDQIKQKGIIIEDTPDGVRWRKIE